ARAPVPSATRRQRWSPRPSMCCRSRSRKSFSRPSPRRTNMLWYRSWLDTRWRFLIGFALLLFSACGTVVAYVELGNLLSTLDTPAIEGSGTLGAAIGEAIEEAIELQRTYRGFVWSQWFDKNLTFLGTFFAALLGSGSPFSGAGRGLLFSLALPVSRGRWLGARAGTGVVGLLVLAVTPSLPLPVLSPRLR